MSDCGSHASCDSVESLNSNLSVIGGFRGQKTYGLECKSYAPQFFKMTKNFDFFEFLAGQNVTAVQESAEDGMECKFMPPNFLK